MDEFEMGLNYFIKGDIVKIDIFKALLDHDSEEELLEKAEKDKNFNVSDYLRYCLINTSLLLVGSSAKNARPLKPYFGKTAYTITTVIELIKR